MFIIKVSNYANMSSMVLDWLGACLVDGPLLVDLLLTTLFLFWPFLEPWL